MYAGHFNGFGHSSDNPTQMVQSINDFKKSMDLDVSVEDVVNEHSEAINPETCKIFP